MAALGAYRQGVTRTLSMSTSSINSLEKWPKEVADAPKQQAVIDKVKDRTDLADAQLKACQTAAEKASADIAAAEGKLAVATTAEDRAIEAANLAAKRAQGDAIVSQMSVAETLLRADIENTVGILERKNRDLANTKSVIATSDITAAITALEKSVNEPKALACAEKPETTATTEPTELTPKTGEGTTTN